MPNNIGAFGENFPYTNYHDMNTDWLVKTMKDNVGEIERLDKRIDDIVIVANEYILPSTNDDTDRSADITKYLMDYGYCFLGAGKFVIYNTINMPEGTSLMGMGSGTILQLADDSPADIAVNVGTLCTVSNMQIVGNSTDLPYESYTQGSRKGVALLGDYTTFGQGTYSHNFAKLSNLTIRNFNHSGIWAYRNDGAASFLATNIDILRCHTGINIELFSEFHSFANIRCRWCNIACVMQGGNNLFSNCHFDVNLMGIKIDNTNSNLVNADHSSFTNCSICHSDNNAGFALWANRSLVGLCFSNCQIWYGKIHMDTCSSIKFSNNIFAGTEIYVNHSNKITFTDNLIRDTNPTITFTECINCIWENNQNEQSNLIIIEADRGALRNLNANIVRVSDIENIQFEAFGVCTATNTWSVVIPLPGVFSMDSFHFDINRIVLLGKGQVSDSDLANVGVTVNQTFVRVDAIHYTGTTGETCLIDVRGHLYQIS